MQRPLWLYTGLQAALCCKMHTISKSKKVHFRNTEYLTNARTLKRHVYQTNYLVELGHMLPSGRVLRGAGGHLYRSPLHLQGLVSWKKRVSTCN